MIRSFHKPISGVLCMFVIAALLTACGSNDNSKEIARLEKQIAEKQTVVKKAQGEVDSFQATVVAGQDEIASLEATVQALTADGNQVAAGQEQPPAESGGERGQFSIVPVSIETKPAGDGWTDYTVQLALANDTDDFVKDYKYPRSGLPISILTEEGFQYPGEYKFSMYGGVSLQIPPRFNLAGYFDDRGHLNNPEVTFEAATNSRPVQADFGEWGKVDLSRTVTVTYPTSRPLHEFDQPDYAFEIPGKGSLHFGQPSLSHQGQPPILWNLVLPVTFQNANQGYNSTGYLECFLIDSDGYWHYGGGAGFGAGPGLTTKNDMTFIVGYTDEEVYALTPSTIYEKFRNHMFPNTDLSNAKLTCSGEGVEFVLALPPLH